MANRVVHMKFFNKTSERLVLDRSGTTENHHSHWDCLPETIPPESSSFLVIVGTPMKSIEGTIAFDAKTEIDDISRTCIRARICCPYLAGRNEFRLYPLKPEAVYVNSFRSRAGKGDWQDNSIASSSSSISIEYTIEYATSRCRFQLVEITAKSDYPVRNSRDELVIGTHHLWRSDSAADWADDNRGSYAPNVFAYEPNSPVAEAGHLKVTIQPLDSELIGAEVVVHGSIDGIRTLQTDNFYIKTTDNVTVPAYVIDPVCSNGPFDVNADIVWSMELCQSLRGVLAVGPHETPLELYWLGKIIHPNPPGGVPIELLRAAFGESSLDGTIKGNATEVSSQTDSSGWNAAMT
ncbi:hypothetical protein Hte_010030 [Hypoxylon texense]